MGQLINLSGMAGIDIISISVLFDFGRKLHLFVCLKKRKKNKGRPASGRNRRQTLQNYLDLFSPIQSSKWN
jgi:hypothetical protein